jgi:glutaredoxin-like protein NrdH
MKTITVNGKRNRHSVLLFALSTCVWCKLTKNFFNENDVTYDYVDVDLCAEGEKEEIRNQIRSMGGSVQYPTIIIDNKVLITGFQKDKLRTVLQI